MLNQIQYIIIGNTKKKTVKTLNGSKLAFVFSLYVCAHITYNRSKISLYRVELEVNKIIYDS